MKFTINLLKKLITPGQEICVFSENASLLLYKYHSDRFQDFSKRSDYFWRKGLKPMPLSVLIEIMNERNIKEIKISSVSIKGGNTLVFNFEKEISFSYFLGLLLGDGCLIHTKRDNNRNTCLVQISFRYKKDSEKIKSLCQKMFSISPSIYKGKGCFNLCIFSKPLVFILNKKYEIPIGEKYSSIKVPEIILKGTKKNKIAFLKGVFDSDGNIYLHRGRKSVQLRQKSKKFLIELFRLFKKVNINFNFPYYDKANNSWVLWSSKKELVDNFIKKITNFNIEASVAQPG